MHKFFSVALTIALLFTHKSDAMLGHISRRVALGAARASHSAVRIQAPMRQMVSNAAKTDINSGQVYNIIRPLTFFCWTSSLTTASIITLVQSKEKAQFEVRQSADATIDCLYQNLLKSTSLDEARVLVNAADEIILEACTNKIAEHLDTTFWYVILAIMERNADAENIFIQATSAYKYPENQIESTVDSDYNASGIMLYAICKEDNKVYILLGKGRKFWSDFGGFAEKADGHSTCTAAREASEELRFIFDDENKYNDLLNLKKHQHNKTSLYSLLVKHASNTYQNLITKIANKSTFRSEIKSSDASAPKTYVQYICQIPYDKNLPQKFEDRKRFMHEKKYVPGSWNEVKELQWVAVDSIIQVVDSISQERNVSVNGMTLRDVFVRSLKTTTPILKNLKKS